jgi:hypothetical protein
LLYEALLFSLHPLMFDARLLEVSSVTLRESRLFSPPTIKSPSRWNYGAKQ